MTQPIPFMDLARLHRSIQPELDDAIQRVIAKSSFIGGDELAAFEHEFAAAHGLEFAAGCGSGTDALALALRALGVGPGDEVVVPAMTFVATAEAVVHAGAAPVLADVDPVTLLLTPEAVEQVRTPRTKAVIPVHLYGHVVPFDSIDSWKDDGLVVIEDAAQAHLATWNNEYVGSHGDAACFSFYPGKNLGALGDGGMVVSREPDVIDRIKKLRDHGRTSKFEHEVPGWCSRLDAIQAAVLRVKLRHLGGWTARRRLLAEIYSSALGAYLVPWSVGAVHHLIVGRFGDPGLISDSLRQGNVGSGRHYPKSLSKHPWLAEGTHTPIADSAAGQLLSLPIDPLMSDNDVERVCHLVEANEIGGTRARPAVPE